MKCEGHVRRELANPNTPAARGVNPRPGADLGCLRQYSRSGPWGKLVHLKRNAHTVICKGFSVLGAEYNEIHTKNNVFQHWIKEPQVGVQQSNLQEICKTKQNVDMFDEIVRK